jgi:hypothetical protein
MMGRVVSGERVRCDRPAVAAVAIALMVAGGYIWLMARQGDRPEIWYFCGIAVVAGLAAYGAVGTAAARTPALATAGTALIGLGVVGILSIGLPLVVAGVFALFAAVRSWSRT